MLPFIPVMIAITLTLAYALNPTNYILEDGMGAQISENLLLEHMRSVHLAQERDMVEGRIEDALTAPLRSMGDWRVEVVSNGGMTVVVTYMPGDPENIPLAITHAFGEIGPKNLRRLPKSYSGNYVYSPAGLGGQIGGGDFSAMELPIPENSPALITIINAAYTEPGGSGSSGSTRGGS